MSAVLNQSVWTVKLPGATFTVTAWHDSPNISRQVDVHQVWKVALPSGRMADDAAHVATIEGWTPRTDEDAERTVQAVASAMAAGRLAQDPCVTVDDLGLLTDQEAYQEAANRG